MSRVWNHQIERKLAIELKSGERTENEGKW